jgi:hypothetical protein
MIHPHAALVGMLEPRRYDRKTGWWQALLPATTLSVAFGLPLPSLACTLCHSPAAQEARLWIGYSFWQDLAGVLACIPFLIAAAVYVAGKLPVISE